MNPTTTIQAVVFDMDGVLTDSEPFYNEAANAVVEKLGLHLTEKDHEAVLGTTVEVTWRWIIDHFKLQGSLEHWLAEYDREIVRILKAKVLPSPGMPELINTLQQRHYRLGLASSSQRNWIDAVLERLKLTRTFEVIVSGDEVKHGKPDPEIYRIAAQRLSVPTKHCLAIEDSPVGIASAKAAGMRAVAVLTPSTAGLDLSKADRVLPTLKEFDWTVMR